MKNKFLLILIWFSNFIIAQNFPLDPPDGDEPPLDPPSGDDVLGASIDNGIIIMFIVGIILIYYFKNKNKFKSI